MPGSCVNSFKISVVYGKEVGNSYQFSCPRGPQHLFLKFFYVFIFTARCQAVFAEGQREKSCCYLVNSPWVNSKSYSFQNPVNFSRKRNTRNQAAHWLLFSCSIRIMMWVHLIFLKVLNSNYIY